ncbi:uncharacterized protein [Coffea arabica]|uniref:Uncharacterized protein isoform X2 n=1 Tax=Coffea arabica TaxID=13443 RepID=A0ABM4WU55_COFAR
MENDLPTHEVQSCRKLDFEGVDSQEINENALPLCITDGNQGNQIFLPLAIPNNLVPKLGMEFDTEVEARNFYQKYAKASGFGTRLSKGHKDKNSDMMLDRVFCCSREGKRPKDKRNMIVKCPRPETRCDCGAMMKISCRQAGKYRVVQFVAQHNHELSTPSKTHLFRSHRHMTMAHEAEIDMEMESKAKLSFRYKELSYLYMQLMTKACECDETYKIAKDGFWKMLEQMDACCQGKKKMKEVCIEERKSVYQDVDTHAAKIDCSKIKGIKVKEKVTYKSSKRPRSALEMATKKRKYKVKEKSSSKRLQTLDPNFYQGYDLMSSSSITQQHASISFVQAQELENNDDSDQQVVENGKIE